MISWYRLWYRALWMDRLRTEAAWPTRPKIWLLWSLNLDAQPIAEPGREETDREAGRPQDALARLRGPCAGSRCGA